MVPLVGGGHVAQPIEMILLRQWSAYQALPVWIMDVHGDLLYYNEPAEELLGLRYDEAGAIHANDLAARFETTNLDGTAIDTEKLPIVIALTQRHPAHAEMRIRTEQGSWRHLHITAFPVEGLGERHLGAVAMFWENPDG